MLGALNMSLHVCMENRKSRRWNEHISRSKKPNPVTPTHKLYTHIHCTPVGVSSWQHTVSCCSLRQSELENGGMGCHKMGISGKHDVQMRFSRRFFSQTPKTNHHESNCIFRWVGCDTGVAQTAKKVSAPTRRRRVRSPRTNRPAAFVVWLAELIHGQVRITSSSKPEGQAKIFPRNP